MHAHKKKHPMCNEKGFRTGANDPGPIKNGFLHTFTISKQGTVVQRRRGRSRLHLKAVSRSIAEEMSNEPEPGVSSGTSMGRDRASGPKESKNGVATQNITDLAVENTHKSARGHRKNPRDQPRGAERITKKRRKEQRPLNYIVQVVQEVQGGSRHDHSKPRNFTTKETEKRAGS